MARSATVPTTRRDRRAAERRNRPPRHRSRNLAPRPLWRSPIVLVTAGALALAAVLIAVALPPAATDQQELRTPPLSYPAELIDGDTLGSAEAPVVVELYSDFQCPACRMFVTQQLHRLVEQFVVPGTLRIAARDIAVIGRGQRDESLELAIGARCAADQDRYWQFHDLVFWNQGRENRGDHSDGFIDQVAINAGVEPTAFEACQDREDARQAMTDQTRAAIAAGIQATPTLIVNGQSIAGVPDYDRLAALINELAAATAPATPSPTP
jgi:protein-disulfide isomerase